MYSSTSTSLRRRGLKRVPRSHLDELMQRAFLLTRVGTTYIAHCTLHSAHCKVLVKTLTTCDGNHGLQVIQEGASGIRCERLLCRTIQ